MNLHLLNQIRGIVDPETYDSFESVMDPDSYDAEPQMSEDLEKIFGYDPTEYFPRKTMGEFFDELLERAPDSVRKVLVSSREGIITRAMQRKSENDEEYLYQNLVSQIWDETGWAAESDPLNLSRQIFQKDMDAKSDFLIDEDDEEEEEDVLPDREDFGDHDDDDYDEDEY